MGAKLRNLTLSLLAASLAAAVWATPAEANRGNNPTTTTTQPGYVPPPQYGQNPFPELPDEPNPYAEVPVEPTVLPVDIPAVTDPGAGLAGDGDRLNPAPIEAPAFAPQVEAAPQNDSFMNGILSRTGAESLPLARAGLAALTLGVGLVVLTRRRRIDAASA